VMTTSDHDSDILGNFGPKRLLPEILGLFEARHKKGVISIDIRSKMAASANPAVAVSAADRAIGVPRVGIGVVVLNSEDHVLIGKRKSPHGQGSPHERIDFRNMVPSWRILPVNAILTPGPPGILRNIRKLCSTRSPRRNESRVGRRPPIRIRRK